MDFWIPIMTYCIFGISTSNLGELLLLITLCLTAPRKELQSSLRYVLRLLTFPNRAPSRVGVFYCTVLYGDDVTRNVGFFCRRGVTHNGGLLSLLQSFRVNV